LQHIVFFFSLRDCVSWLKQKYFMNYPHHRAEFFPVEWRSNLQLDGELVDAITPNTLQSLRQMLNASAMDIMYYTSPLYGGEVSSLFFFTLLNITSYSLIPIRTTLRRYLTLTPTICILFLSHSYTH